MSCSTNELACRFDNAQRLILDNELYRASGVLHNLITDCGGEFAYANEVGRKALNMAAKVALGLYLDEHAYMYMLLIPSYNRTKEEEDLLLKCRERIFKK